MKFLPFVVRQLRYTWIRTGSTMLAMALSIFLFCTLQAALTRIDAAIEGHNPRRLVTTNVTQMSALPPSYADRIARVPGVRRVARMVMFGGFLRATKEGRPESGFGSDWTNFFQNVAVDARPYFAMSPELTVPSEQFRDFMKDMRGCVIGRKLAEKLRWRIGDHFFLESFASGFRKPDGPFEFVVRGFVEADLREYPGAETDMMFFHYRYLEAALGPATRTSLYMVEIDDDARAAEVGSAIDALFENSSDPTLTQTEKAFLADLMSMVGDVSRLLNGLGLAVCFTILLVSANTMSMAVRQRRTEIAVLKTLGFTSARVMGLILVESVIIAASGAVIGLGGTEVVLWVLNHRPGLTLPGVATLEVSPRIRLLSLGVALLLGLAAGALPAWAAYRAKIAEMLRAV